MWQWFRAKFDSLFVLSTTSIGSSQSPSVRGGNSRKSQEIKSLKRKKNTSEVESTIIYPIIPPSMN